jgi:hypothetical protein
VKRVKVAPEGLDINFTSSRETFWICLISSQLSAALVSHIASRQALACAESLPHPLLRQQGVFTNCIAQIHLFATL